MFQAKPFPIPVISQLSPGSQTDEEPVDFMPMPREMDTYQPPRLPEPEQLAAQQGAVAALHAALAALRAMLAADAGGAAGSELRAAPIELTALDDADRRLLNQVLGEGEVAAQATGAAGISAQESVFAGVWRVLHREGETVVRDTLEVGRFPQAIAAAARAEGVPLAPLPALLPPDTMNSPAVLEELREQALRWQQATAAGAVAGAEAPAPHVVNLSLLPLTPGDSLFFEQQLGRGRVMVLSRGYGNCRVVNTGAAAIWRVTYFNSQDMIILDTLEVGDVPEVACAARQDLENSAERLAEVLAWVHTA